MTAIVFPKPADAEPTGGREVRLAVAIALTAWFLLVASLGAVGAFIR